MKISAVKETCLYVQDLHRTRDFYHHKLGLPIISFKEGRHVFFRAGSSVLLCFDPSTTRQEEELPPHFGSGQLHFAFAVQKSDYESAKKHILSLNIPIEHEHDWGKGYKSIYFRDPDHHAVEIVMEGMWGE